MGFEEINLDQVWIGADDLPVHYVNAYAGVVGPNAIFLSLGSHFPPEIGSEEELEQLKARGYTSIKPIARFAVAPDGLDELIEVLETTRSNHQELRRELEEQDHGDEGS